MQSAISNIAVILAGGIGSRVGGNTPKQLLPLEDGRSVLEHAIDAFRQCPCIDDVLVVMHPDWIDYVQGVPCIPGGRERWESSIHAIDYLNRTSYIAHRTCNVLLHDAARPFVSRRIIEDVCRALETHEAVTVAVPATDTMYSLSPDPSPGGEGRIIKDIPDRSTMMRAQTPQAFRLPLIKQAYDLALQDPNLQATDDCGIVHRYLPDQPIYIVLGDEQNRKITFREDLSGL